MPTKNAAIKALRQNVKRATRNTKVKSDIAALIRHVRKAIAAKDTAGATKWLGQAIQKMDKAAGKKIIKKNTAARKKSRLAKAVAALAAKK